MPDQDTENIFSRELTFSGAAALLLKRRRWVILITGTFMLAGLFAALSVRPTWSVSCTVKTVPEDPGAPSPSEELNAGVFNDIRAAVPPAGFFDGVSAEDAVLWRQTLSISQLERSRLILISGRAYSAAGAVRLAGESADLLVATHNKAGDAAARQAAARADELRRLKEAAGVLASDGAAGRAARNFAGAMRVWSEGETARLEAQLAARQRAVVVRLPEVSKALARPNTAFVLLLAWFLGLVTSLVVVLWLEAWRHGASSLF